MTSAVAGFNAEIALSTDGGSTYVTISEQAELTLTVEGNPIEVTNFDSGGVTEYIAGPYDWSGDTSGNMVVGDSAQVDVFNELTGNNAADIRVRPAGSTTGDPELTGTIQLSNLEYSPSATDEVEWSFEFQGTGDLTRTTQ